MSKIKTIGLAGMAIIAGTVTPAVMAQTVDLYYGPYAYSEGGEFTAVTTPNVFNQNYSPLALVNVTDDNNQTQTGFETFCVQTQVDFTPYNWGNPTPYNYSISLSSIGLPDNFALSEGTAYLYEQFATGQLQGYDYTDASTRITDAGILQAAIWDLQGGQSYPGFPNGAAGNPYYNDALTALGAGALGQAVTLDDNFGVEILNMTDANGGNAQNQLVYTGGGNGFGHQAVPDGGATLALLAMSAGGLACVRRKLGSMRKGS